MRITTNAVSNRLLAQIQHAQQRLAVEQEKVGSGKRVNRPSDDPFATARVLASYVRSENNLQYQRNISVAKTDLAASEAALTSLHAVLARASELATQAASQNLSAQDRANIGLEVTQLLNEAITLGNTRHGDRFLFSGHQTSTKPFTEDIPGNPTAVTYAGDTGLIQREITQGERLSVNLTGDQVFPGVFTTLIQFRDALMGDNLPGIQGAAGFIGSQIDSSLKARSDTGARMRRVEVAETRLQDEYAAMEAVRSNLQDVDLAEAIVKLQVQETAYQAAIGVAGRTLNRSLIDFLR